MNTGSANSTADMKDVSDLLLDFAITLMGVGTQTSRVLRNVERLAAAYGYKADLIILPRTVMMTIADGKGGALTELRKVKPSALNFRVLSELRILSWDVYKNKLPIAECRRRYNQILLSPRISGLALTLTVAFGNAAFCRLFGGFYSVPLVFIGTFFGFSARTALMKAGANHLVVYAVAAFISAFIAGLGAKIFDFQTDIGLSASVLFLIPGVPLINSVIDLLEGHVLAGLSRLVNAMTLIFALTAGLLIAIFLLGKGII